MTKTKTLRCGWHDQEHPISEFWENRRDIKRGYQYSCKKAHAEMRELRLQRKAYNLSRAQEMGLLPA